jgi:uncharacterized protein YggU (UPF0235/DUF167 family)
LIEQLGYTPAGRWALLAAASVVPGSELKILAGGKSPLKLVEIASLSEDEIFARLAHFGVWPL